MDWFPSVEEPVKATTDFAKHPVNGKIQKSAVELAKIIRSQLAEPKLRLAVYPNSSGWHAKVYAGLGSARDLQKRVDGIVPDLNGLYELGT